MKAHILRVFYTADKTEMEKKISCAHSGKNGLKDMIAALQTLFLYNVRNDPFIDENLNTKAKTDVQRCLNIEDNKYILQVMVEDGLKIVSEGEKHK